MSLFDGEPDGPPRSSKAPLVAHGAAGGAHAAAQPRRVQSARNICSALASPCGCRSSATIAGR